MLCLPDSTSNQLLPHDYWSSKVVVVTSGEIIFTDSLPRGACEACLCLGGVGRLCLGLLVCAAAAFGTGHAKVVWFVLVPSPRGWIRCLQMQTWKSLEIIPCRFISCLMIVSLCEMEKGPHMMGTPTDKSQASRQQPWTNPTPHTTNTLPLNRPKK